MFCLFIILPASAFAAPPHGGNSLVKGSGLQASPCEVVQADAQTPTSPVDLVDETPSPTLPGAEVTITAVNPPAKAEPTSQPLELTGIEPKMLPAGSGGAITLMGKGFEDGMTVRLVGYGLLQTGTLLPNLLQALVPGDIPAGVYTVQAVRLDGYTVSLEDSLSVV
jgi:hypothetical protein